MVLITTEIQYVRTSIIIDVGELIQHYFSALFDKNKHHAAVCCIYCCDFTVALSVILLLLKL